METDRTVEQLMAQIDDMWKFDARINKRAAIESALRAALAQAEQDTYERAAQHLETLMGLRGRRRYQGAGKGLSALIRSRAAL